MNKKKLSIVIVTYNSTRLIEECLNSIFKFNDLGEDLEIIIVDNNSSDIDILEEIININFSRHLIKLIRNIENNGYGQGNNVGVDASSAEIILITNPDVVFFKPIFKSGIYHFYRNDNLSILGLQQYENKKEKSQSFLMLHLNLINLLFHKFYKVLNIYNENLFCFSGACFFIKKQDFIDVGCFDENIFLYGEERDLHYRLRATKKRGFAKYNKYLPYLHPMHKRSLSIDVFKKGLNSTIYTAEKNNKNVKKVLKGELWIYRLMYLKTFFGNNMELRSYYQTIIQLLKCKINNENVID